jgi:hypothetical protein
VAAGSLVHRIAVHQAAGGDAGDRAELSRDDGGLAVPGAPGPGPVAPDGFFAASGLIWLDEANGVGLLEPVGADARCRRLGLGRAVGLAAMRALRAAGAREAVVYPTVGGKAHPGALSPYHQYARRVEWVGGAGGTPPITVK